MSNTIELEASFHLEDNYDNLLEKIRQERYEFIKEVIEEDTYFTDSNMTFIHDRICLRTRKVNEEFLELTYKPKTANNTEKYGKKEVNLKIDPKDYNDTKYILEELGYKEYVSFKKLGKYIRKLLMALNIIL